MMDWEDYGLKDGDDILKAMKRTTSTAHDMHKVLAPVHGERFTGLLADALDAATRDNMVLNQQLADARDIVGRAEVKYLEAARKNDEHDAAWRKVAEAARAAGHPDDAMPHDAAVDAINDLASARRTADSLKAQLDDERKKSAALAAANEALRAEVATARIAVETVQSSTLIDKALTEAGFPTLKGDTTSTVYGRVHEMAKVLKATKAENEVLRDALIDIARVLGAMYTPTNWSAVVGSVAALHAEVVTSRAAVEKLRASVEKLVAQAANVPTPEEHEAYGGFRLTGKMPEGTNWPLIADSLVCWIFLVAKELGIGVSPERIEAAANEADELARHRGGYARIVDALREVNHPGGTAVAAYDAAVRAISGRGEAWGEVERLRGRVDELLTSNNAYLNEARDIRAVSLRRDLTLVAVEADRDYYRAGYDALVRVLGCMGLAPHFTRDEEALARNVEHLCKAIQRLQESERFLRGVVQSWRAKQKEGPGEERGKALWLSLSNADNHVREIEEG